MGVAQAAPSTATASSARSARARGLTLARGGVAAAVQARRVGALVRLDAGLLLGLRLARGIGRRPVVPVLADEPGRRADAGADRRALSGIIPPRAALRTVRPAAG